MRAPGRLWTVVLYLLLIMLIEAAVHPVGDFPLNDDWAYAQTVRALLEGRGFVPTAWGSMTMLTNVVWGALFAVPFGFSHDVLRASTIVAGFGLLLAMDAMFRAAGMARTERVMAVVSIAASPLFVALSNTFMTDILYTGISVTACLCFMNVLRTGAPSPWIAGLCLAVLATLSRQIGISIALAFALVSLAGGGWTLRRVLMAAMPLAASVGAFLLLQSYLNHAGRMPPGQADATHALAHALTTPGTTMSFLIVQSTIALLYGGWLLMPALLVADRGPGATPRGGRARGLGIVLAACAVLAPTIVLIGSVRHPMPFTANVIKAQGIGPWTLYGGGRLDSGTAEPDVIPSLPFPFWEIVTCLAIGGAVLILRGCWRLAYDGVAEWWTDRWPEAAPRLFLLLAALIYLFPPLAVPTLAFDRYYLPALPLIAAALAGQGPPRAASRRARIVMALLVLCLTGSYAILGTRDYLALNRLRWQAVAALAAERGAGPADIDGGFEYNGLYRYDAGYVAAPGKSSFWVTDQRFALSLEARDGWRAWRTYPVPSLLHPGGMTLYVLERADAAAQANPAGK